MSWLRAGFISEKLLEALIPLCVYGMLSALVLHLLDMRAVIIHGDIERLRLATLAFTACIVLLERLAYYEGSFIARNYRYGVGFTITFFAVNFTKTYAAFGLIMALYLILWWCGHKLSKAVSVNDDKAVETAAESGVLRGLRFWRRRDSTPAPPAPDAPAASSANRGKWTDKLTARHPGRVLLYFSLVALPLFGAGLLFFGPDDPARFRLGLELFLYLWCALALLFLSSLRQLAVYFRRREVSLPDLIGLPWLGLGFVGVTMALALAFLLPQPPSPLGIPVRTQLESAYKGWESRYGVGQGNKPGKDGGSGGGQDDNSPARKGWSRDNIHKLEDRFENIDKINDPELSNIARNSGLEPEARKVAALSAAVNDTVRDGLQFVMRLILAIGAVGAVAVALITIMVFIKRLREGAGESWDRMKKLLLREAKKKPPVRPAVRLFPRFSDPFGDPELAAEPNRLIRYLWEATLAFCHDAGEPCSPDLTPLEFIETAPGALRGFEPRARFIARVFTFSEFSSQPVAEASPTELRRFWHDLQRHAAGV